MVVEVIMLGIELYKMEYLLALRRGKVKNLSQDEERSSTFWHNQYKMRITQATSNPLEYLLVLRQGKVKNPSQSPRSEPKTITTLHWTILAAPSRLGGGNYLE